MSKVSTASDGLNFTSTNEETLLRLCSLVMHMGIPIITVMVMKPERAPRAAAI